MCLFDCSDLDFLSVHKDLKCECCMLFLEVSLPLFIN